MNPIDKSVRCVYGEIVRKDCYRLNEWPNNFFDNIIDIGANVGLFVLYTHMRHPKAKIFAYEPCVKTYEDLKKNTWYLENIYYFNKALGNGDPLFFHDTGWPACNLFYETKSDSSSITSCTLTKIFEEIKISDKYLIKIDCEGGERFLLGDKDSVEIIKKSHAFCLEIHFPPKNKNSQFYERFKTFPSWNVYNAWIYDNFEKTHKIVYCCSDGKKRGAGLYILKLKF
jgi:FkbM family methyltransferase